MGQRTEHVPILSARKERKRPFMNTFMNAFMNVFGAPAKDYRCHQCDKICMLFMTERERERERERKRKRDEKK